MKFPTRLLASAAALLFSTGIAAAATVVAEADVNLRSGPGTQYPIIALIPVGAPVDVTSCGGNWCHVDYRDQIGWVSSTYLGGAGPAIVQAEPYYAQPYYSFYDYYVPSYPFSGYTHYGVGPGHFRHFHHWVVGGSPGPFPRHFGHHGPHVALQGPGVTPRVGIAPRAGISPHVGGALHIGGAGPIGAAPHFGGGSGGPAPGGQFGAPRHG